MADPTNTDKNQRLQRSAHLVFITVLVDAPGCRKAVQRLHGIEECLHVFIMQVADLASHILFLHLTRAAADEVGVSNGR